MKFIAFYLPQFHEIPENNDAWGNGFTEWVNVKKSKPLFWGHNQPRIPLNNNYYNLLDRSTLKWQTRLANRYKVDGFALYHYWFNGRLVLEKPVRIIAENPDLKIEYCFAWANESWTKTWHGAGGDKEVLIQQTYGGEEEWEKHYQYFLTYFKDDRYLKKNGKPILIIYKLQNISRFNDMLKYWKRRAIEDGFNGLYIIAMRTAKSYAHLSKWVDGTVDFEPNNTKYARLSTSQKKFKPREKSRFLWNRFMMRDMCYSEINYQMLAKKHNKNEFRTVYVDYDDTPRRGYNGIFTKGSTPRRFEYFLKRNIQISKKEKNDLLFINAWNEWGEGNYLEPDKKNKYAYLNAILRTRNEMKI